jgi:hypothetical protein
MNVQILACITMATSGFGMRSFKRVAFELEVNNSVEEWPLI